MRSFALVVAVVVVVAAGGAKARRRGLVDNDDDDEDDIVASVDRSARDGRLNADLRISMILFAVVAKSTYGCFNVASGCLIDSMGAFFFRFCRDFYAG